MRINSLWTRDISWTKMDLPLAVDEDVDKRYTPSRWALALKGVDRIQRYLHLCDIQNERNNLPEPIEHIQYGKEQRQGLDVMKCSTAEKVLVFVHGGYWLEGSRELHNFISHGLHQHNISVVTVGYRLATAGSGLDECVEDVVMAIEKVQELFADSPILLAGHSAGGHLVMAALPRLRTLQGIEKVFLVSAIYFLQEVANSSVGVQIGLTREQVDLYSISPHPWYDKVDLQHIVGQFDPPSFLKQAERFANRMARKGFQKKRVIVVPDEDHFSIVENLFYERAALTRLFAGVYSPKKHSKF